MQADFEPELPGRVSFCWDNWPVVEAEPAKEPVTVLNEWNPVGSSLLSQFSKPGLGNWYWLYVVNGRANNVSNRMPSLNFLIILF